MIPKKPSDAMWSDEQWNAIFLRGNNILVSAGAGSGKTAVLSERVLQYVLQGNSVSRLIILTFTNASAAEMKDRIRKCLIKNKDSIDPIELELLEGAHIETFDAFFLSIVKKYHYLLNVSKNIKIGDKVILTYNKKRILNELFQELYDAHDKDFLAILDLLTTKDDEELKKVLLKVNDKLNLLQNRKEAIKNFVEYYSLDSIKKNITEYQKISLVYCSLLKEYLNDLLDKYDGTYLYEHIQDYTDSFSKLVFSQSVSEVKDNLCFKSPSVPKGLIQDEKTKNELKKDKDKIRNIVKQIEGLFEMGESELIYQIESTKNHCLLLINLLEKFNDRFMEFKKANNMYDFMDIAKLAIKLFRENEKLRLEFKNSYDEILIDEYQDTSDIQEELISLISNNNTYMVGDIKQSIYRFRNANPKIFKDKYDSYLPYKEDMDIKNVFGIRIDLAKNFRSRQEPLQNINWIFEKLMDKDLGGADYNNGHRLIFGNKSYLKDCPNDYNMEFYTYDIDYQKPYVEAYIIARDIKEKLNSGYQCFDKSKKELYLASYRDFTILTASKSNYEIYANVFEYFGIPLVVHKDEAFFNSDEIYALSNIIKLVYCLIDEDYYKGYFKPCMVSLLRSFLVAVKDDDIREGIDDLPHAFPSVFNQIVKLKEIALTKSLDKLLLAIYQEFDVYKKSILIGKISEIENKLNYLVLKVTELGKMGYDIKDLVGYFDIIISEGTDIEFETPKSNVDAVNIMTIHKSKGLEFPVCYFSDLTTRFNMEEMKDKITFDANLGLIMPYDHEGLGQTFYKDLLKHNYLFDEIGEKIRLFYVALTRAKEKIIFVGPRINGELKEKVSFVSMPRRIKFVSLYDMLISTINQNNAIDDGYNNIRNESIIKSQNLDSFLEDMKSLGQKNSQRLEVLNKEYETLFHPLKGIQREEKKASIDVLHVMSIEERKALDFGTYVHSIFEAIDFNNPNYKEIDYKIRGKIRAFLESDFIKSLSIINVYKEFNFSYDNQNGVIDLILETNDEMIIIDYKLKDISKEGYYNQLKAYCNYLKTITDKPVKAYLYSIFEEIFEVIE